MTSSLGLNAAETDVTTYTSVVYPPNYDWIVDQGGTAAQDVPTFGAAL